MSIEKGNIVRSKKHDTTAIVLAITKDGKRAKCYVYGPDTEAWRPLSSLKVDVSGIETCWKCGGSGIFYISGATVNGVFQGSSGECFGCGGNGKQDNADRLRNHYYWHRKSEEYAAMEEGERAKTEAPEAPLPPKDEGIKATVAAKRANKRHNHPDPERKALGKPKRKRTREDEVNDLINPPGDPVKLIDCQQCGCHHRDDVSCPWGPGRTI